MLSFVKVENGRAASHGTPSLLATHAAVPSIAGDLLFAICADCPLTVRHLRGEEQDAETVAARRLLVLIARRYLSLSWPTIGRVANRDHSAVLRMYRTAARRWQADPGFRRVVVTTLNGLCIRRICLIEPYSVPFAQLGGGQPSVDDLTLRERV